MLRLVREVHLQLLGASHLCVHLLINSACGSKSSNVMGTWMTIILSNYLMFWNPLQVRHGQPDSLDVRPLVIRVVGPVTALLVVVRPTAVIHLVLLPVLVVVLLGGQ